MTTTQLPAGYEAHVEGMSEEANDARCKRNEVTDLRNQLEQRLITLDHLQDEIIRNEAAVSLLRREIEFLTGDDEG